MNALVGTAEENDTVNKVGEYMRAGDDDPNIRVIVLTWVARGFCSGAKLGSRASAGITGENLSGNRSTHEGPSRPSMGATHFLNRTLDKVRTEMFWPIT